jgi:putative restriction endonuclease
LPKRDGYAWMVDRRGVVAVTDDRWFEFLRAQTSNGQLDEVNFWRPVAQTAFRALDPGEPFFFRLKHPVNAIVGFGFYAHATHLPIRMAWEAFGPANGDGTYERFLGRIAEYRRETPAEVVLGPRELTCIILRSVTFLREEQWLRWGGAEDWKHNIVAFKSYDLDRQPGLRLAELLRSSVPADLASVYQPQVVDERRRDEVLQVVREGQGAFRVRVLDAYDRRCAVTGERSLPVLDAAHIQPYLGAASNHVQNGLSLRADIHRLYDAGYVTVTPQLRFEVSKRLRDDYENGRAYYELDGEPLKVVPKRRDAHPSAAALEWHAVNVFR